MCGQISGSWQGLRVLTGTMSPRQQFPPPTCHFSPTDAAMPGPGVIMINSCLMAKLSGPIPVCLLSCKTFPWLTRENLREKGKRLGFQNIKLPLPLLPANLPTDHLKKRKPTALEGARARGWGLGAAALPADRPCLFRGKAPQKIIHPVSCPGPDSLHAEKKPGPAKGTTLPPYLVTKISTGVYSRASKYLVSAFHVPDSPTLSPKFIIRGLSNKDQGREGCSDLRM